LLVRSRNSIALLAGAGGGVRGQVVLAALVEGKANFMIEERLVNHDVLG